MFVLSGGSILCGVNVLTKAIKNHIAEKYIIVGGAGLDPERFSEGGGILLLQEVDRLTDICLCFSAGEYYMITAIGEMVDDADPLDETPSPYDFSGFTAMPTVGRTIQEE